MKKKLTPEEKKQLQAMLDKQRLLEHEKNMKTLKDLKGSSVAVPGFHDVHFKPRRAFTTPGSRAKELERRKRKERAGKGPGLRQMKLTEEEKKELEAKIRGTK